LTRREAKPQTIDELILEVVREARPSTVEDLVKTVQGRRDVPTEVLVEHVTRLQESGKLALKKPELPVPKSFLGYLSSRLALWFWSALALLGAATLSVLFIPSETMPLAYVRWALGFLLILFLPGYYFIELLFPARKSLDGIERVTLSVGASLAISPLTVLVLNFVFYIGRDPVLVSLALVTFALAWGAVFRRYRTLAKEAQGRVGEKAEGRG